MKIQLSHLFILIFCFFVTGCDFDKQRQLDLEYPVSFEIINQLQKIVVVKSIYNSIDARSGFVLEGDKIMPGQAYKLKISEENFAVISSGQYFMEVSCEDGSNITVDGKQLKNQVVHNVQEWKIIIELKKCNNK